MFRNGLACSACAGSNRRNGWTCGAWCACGVRLRHVLPDKRVVPGVTNVAATLTPYTKTDDAQSSELSAGDHRRR
jgi:hypothetical protein